MKRSFLYLALGAMALTACTSENVLEDAAKTRNAIGFENVVKKPTRADLTTTTLTNMYVYGYYNPSTNDTKAIPVFYGTEVNNEDAAGWNYESETRYWVPDAKYYFFAYSCGNAEIAEGMGKIDFDVTGSAAANQRLLEIKNYVSNYSNQEDLIYASNTGTPAYSGIVGQAKDNDNVSLAFSHLLTKVQAQFQSNFPAEYTMTISDVKINKINYVADYDQEKGWNNYTEITDDTHAYVELADGDNMTAQKANGTATATVAKSQAAYVLPYTYGEDNTVEITFTLTLKHGDDVILVRNLIGSFAPTWVAGHAYTYNIEIDGTAAGLEEIKFDVEGNVNVEGWESSDVDDMEITWKVEE